jgi:hypothetical protein
MRVIEPEADVPSVDLDSQLVDTPVAPPTSFFEFDNAVATDLVTLHNELAQLAPIVGVSGFGPDMAQYRIDFAADASSEQIAAAQAFLLNWPVIREKRQKIQYNYALLDRWFSEQIAAGCPVSAGFTLGLTDSDITLLTGNYILAQAAATADLPIPELIDKNRVSHAIADMAELTAIMLEYGQYRANLSRTYAERKAIIDAAAAE